MLHIRSVSDLHLEFLSFAFESVETAADDLNALIPPLSTDKETVLVVAGDLAPAKMADRIKTFFKLVTPRFLHILYVLGNHEHYHGNLSKTESVIEEALREVLSEDEFKKVTIAGNEPKRVQIEGVTFLLGTLWTDYGAKSSDVFFIRSKIAHSISDHFIIDTPKKVPASPEELSEIHTDTVDKFEEWLSEGDNSKTVVVTHHMPSMQAVHPMYMEHPTTKVLNHAFASDLDWLILEHKPALWIFGHTHTKYIEKLGETQLHCNPGGYPHEQKFLGAYDSTKVYSL